MPRHNLSHLSMGHGKITTYQPPWWPSSNLWVPKGSPIMEHPKQRKMASWESPKPAMDHGGLVRENHRTKSWKSSCPCVIGGYIPSGKRLHNYGKSPFFMEKLTINGDFPISSIVMLVYQRVYPMDPNTSFAEVWLTL